MTKVAGVSLCKKSALAICFLKLIVQSLKLGAAIDIFLL